jgi:hypothetical protein
MNQARRDALAVARERDWLHRKVNSLELELRVVGVLFSSLGELLQADPPIINFDVESVRKAVAGLPRLVSAYSQAAVDEADLNRELARLTALPPCTAPQSSRLLHELDSPEIYVSPAVAVQAEMAGFADADRANTGGKG